MSEKDGGLRDLLEFLRDQRGFDFSGYKPASLERRLKKRMDAVKVEDYRAYQEFLELQPDEFAALFDTILINVTAFFRDAPAWEYVAEQVVPAVLAARPTGDIRVWSAGCASGEEPYSIAMLLVEALGDEAFHERVKIYATDVDEQALEEGRRAVYPVQALERVPAELAERCFERSDGRAAFRPDLRRAVIFGRNDLVQDAPISRIDILLCRNTLMYFTAETQARIASRFNFALRESGFLFLGKSEMLLSRGGLFSPVDLKCRVFRKIPRETLRDRLADVAVGRDAGDGDGDGPVRELPQPLRSGAFEASPLAQVVVDHEGRLVQANREARAMLGIASGDVGRPLQELNVSIRPVELRSAIQRASAEKRPLSVGGVAYLPAAGGGERRFDVQVIPLLGEAGAVLGSTVTFADVTDQTALTDQLDRSRRELEVAYEELQSTVEELETTNEELQSTNEELETTNEELQSTNEELETLNDELRERTNELDNVNAAFEAILKSLEVAVVVVDRDTVVRIWNLQADDLWGVRSEEAVGRHVFGLDIGLPTDVLRTPMRAALDGESPEPIELDATNRRGKPFRCRVVALPLYADGRADVRGAILLMEQAPQPS